MNTSAEILQAYKKAFPNEYVEMKGLNVAQCSVCIEKRNGVVYVYVFNELCFIDSLDDSNVIYSLDLEEFYEKCTYEIDKSNPYSMNEYTTKFESEDECTEFFKSLEIKTM